MAEIALSQAGAVVGSALLPNGLTVFGQQVAGAAIGRYVGQLAGRAIDASLRPPIEGARVKTLSVMESREGAGLPTVYGRYRVGGQVIWASRFRELKDTRSAGKGGPRYTEYSYTVSFAVALCEGPVTRVDRIWANNEPLEMGAVTWRLYQGSEAQEPDPLIEAIEGAGNAPAYRGTAYIVFEDLPLEAFGNRMPQLSFEVVRAGADEPDTLRDVLHGVNVIPASGEFVYGTTVVRERRFPGIERALNMNNGDGRSDFSVSVDQLKADLPRVGSAALTVAWFGTSVEAGACELRPGVETYERGTVPYAWSVDGLVRGAAHLVSRDESGGAVYGSLRFDRTLLDKKPGRIAEAELVGEDTWRLSRLLRGLDGTVVQSVVAGAVVVLADSRLVEAAVSAEEIGLELVWRAEEADSVVSIYEDRGGLPLPVGHLRRVGREVSWTRRGREVVASWALPEAAGSGDYLIEWVSGGAVIGTDETIQPLVSLMAGAEAVRVAQRGDDRRVGPWVSISLESS